MIYEESGHYITQDSQGGYIVFRPSKSGTHSGTDSAYPAGPDGLALAICRVMYLARGAGRFASEAQAKAESILASAKAMGRKRSAALADFDAQFMKGD